MAAWTELQERDRLMDYFISTDPLSIALHRPTMGPDGAGGVIQVGEDVLDPQTFMLYPFKRRLTQEYKYNPQSFGEEKAEYIAWILIFKRSHDIVEGDYFLPSTDIAPATDRLEEGIYTVTFISARDWDRGQAGLLYRG